MKIIDVRDGFIKLKADDERLYLSSFVRVNGADKDYVAQINSLKVINNITIAYAKILFIMQNEELFNYDNTQPCLDAEVTLFTIDILTNSIMLKKPVIIGKTLDDSCNIVLDSSAFNKKMLISVDDINLNNLLLRNISKQFDNLGINTIIIDTNKVVKTQKYTAGKDFKLPLNKLTLQYLYQTCINNATPDSRQMIAEVFEDLNEYFSSVDFVPFSVFKNVVDDIVDKQHIFKLFVLKNKLSFLNKSGYFAENPKEAESLNKILTSKGAVIDISSIDAEFQNYYIEYIYSRINPEKSQVLFEVSNIVSKQNLKMIIKDSEVPTTIVAHSKYRFLNEIKAMFDNFIIEPTLDNKSIFRVYNSFLSSMSNDTYLITGEGINYIPMISKVKEIDEVIELKFEAEESVSETAESVIEGEKSVPETAESVMKGEESVPETAADVTVEISESDLQDNNEEKISQEELFANIEQKSEEIIDSISENTDDIQTVDLFSEDELEDEAEYESDEELELSDEIKNESYEDAEITPDELDAEVLSNEEQPLQEEVSDVIEPEYETVSDNLETDDSTIIIDEQEDELCLDNIDNELPEISEDEPLAEENQEISLGDEQVDSEADSYEDISEPEMAEELIPEYDDSEQNAEMLEITEPDLYVEPKESEGMDTDDNDDFETIVELDPDETDENDIIIDLSDEEENININEDVDRQIVEDVDKVYTTMKGSEDADDISDSDLDLIDELNSDSDEVLLEEYSDTLSEEILEQPSESIIPEKQPANDSTEILEKRDSTTPIVPVYDADIPQEDMVVSDPIQQGDTVMHAKYGNGIVEKMIKYGTKTLFSINFENIGRRLLDPTLTEIKKV